MERRELDKLFVELLPELIAKAKIMVSSSKRNYSAEFVVNSLYMDMVEKAWKLKDERHFIGYAMRYMSIQTRYDRSTINRVKKVSYIEEISREIEEIEEEKNIFSKVDITRIRSPVIDEILKGNNTKRKLASALGIGATKARILINEAKILIKNYVEKIDFEE